MQSFYANLAFIHFNYCKFGLNLNYVDEHNKQRRHLQQRIGK